MMNRKPVAHLPTLLVAAMAALASGQALADSAGHVSFVSGPVTATSPDGHTRALLRGQDINSGDRISTGAGRLQIRFSDGGFVALQPNTVFSVDQYVYANRKPEESSLFFNLLRGGMRTITGVIGHINKASYRVKTPVATIGIRGTEYLAEYDGGELHVTVGLGSVNVENGQGSITLISGQTAKVLPGQAPQQSNDQADIGAPAPWGSGSGNLPGTATAGNQTTADGGVPGTGGGSSMGAPLASTNPLTGAPAYSLATLNDSSNQPFTGSGGSANFDPTSGALLQATGPSGFNIDRGTMQYANVTTVDQSVSLGEITNGTTGNLTLAQGQYVSYAVGVTPTISIPTTGTIGYSLLAATPPRYNGSGTGTMNSFNLTVDLANMLLGVNFDLSVTPAGQTASQEYVGNAQGVAINSTDNGKSFNVSASGGNQVTGQMCSNSGCDFNMAGFFAGSNGGYVGAVYSISPGTSAPTATTNQVTTTSSGNTITGSVALGSTGVPTNPTSSAPLTSGNGYTFVLPVGYNGAGLLLATGMNATFDQTSGAVTGVSDVDANGTPTVQVFSSSNNNDLSSLNFTNLATLGNITYGVLTNGTGTITASNGTSGPLTLSSTEYLPYVAGTPSAPVQDQILTYGAVAGTPARGIIGSTAVTGQLDDLVLTLNTGSGLMGVNLTVQMPSSTYTATGSNLAGLDSNGNFALTGLSVSGGSCTSPTSCTASVGGLLASGGTQAGAIYQIGLQAGSISGAAVLNGQATTSASYEGTGLVSLAPGQYIMADTSYNDIPGGGGGVVSTQATDGSGLLTASSVQSSQVTATTVKASTYTSPVIGRSQSDPVADTGSYGTLEWGRWVGGTDVTVYGYASSTAITNTNSVHYVTGALTTAADMNTMTGTVNYTLAGATSPTNGSAVGTLSSATLSANFGTGQLGVDLQVAFGTTAGYSVQGNIGLTSGQAAFGGTVATTGTAGNACTGNGCTTEVDGFFSGPKAAGVGLGYVITDAGTGTTVQGAAAFKSK